MTLYKERPLFQQETKIKRDVNALLPHNTLVQNLDEKRNVFLVCLIETSDETLASFSAQEYTMEMPMEL